MVVVVVANVVMAQFSLTIECALGFVHCVRRSSLRFDKRSSGRVLPV
jgi:hypothetical protein